MSRFWVQDGGWNGGQRAPDEKSIPNIPLNPGPFALA